MNKKTGRQLCEQPLSSCIDFVITWVDGNDPKWQQEKSTYEHGHSNDEMFNLWSNTPSRYRDWETLRYWFRGVERFAPWVHKIYFVTWEHFPKWLNIGHPKLEIIRHKDYIPAKYLPTFNSHTIEWNIHRIPGLTEQFVYFNDDVFLNAPVKKEDFFQNGCPCETPGFSVVILKANDGNADINNMKIINKYFNKKDVLTSSWRKWFLPIYRDRLIRTILLLPWDFFTGMYYDHLCSPHLKSTFEKLWDIEADLLDSTCSCRFRESNNVNHWLAREWNIVTGNFVPKKSDWGKSFFKPIDKEICSAITHSKYKCICINDVECDEKEFIHQKHILHKAFEIKFPEKSSFEIEND